MIVQVDSSSPVPVFEQLRAQIERLIVSGQFAPGSTLPPMRHLAADLGLARGTVSKVYDALARDGLVATAGRRGTVVLPPARARTTTAELADAADRLAVVARQLDLDATATHAALSAALTRLPPPPPPDLR